MFGLYITFNNQYRTYISDYHTYAGLSASEKSKKFIGAGLSDFVSFCERNIPENATINWETYSSFDQFRLAYYLLYPRKLSPEPDYLLVYHSGTDASRREYAFHPFDISIKIPDKVIYASPGETIRQTWVSGANTDSISQINLFIDNDFWSKNDRLKLELYQADKLLRTIVKDKLDTQSSPRTTFVFDPYLQITPNTQYYFAIRLLTTSKNKIRVFANSQEQEPAGTAMRFGNPQPYTLCFQVFRGYTEYSMLTTY
ncbi:MAG: hypothetical protein QMD09_13125, partial [Desulfatibacillaceae bacterium]|nr:hypothetical protein [Desulfatibacillaceae bacterium]